MSSQRTLDHCLRKLGVSMEDLEKAMAESQQHPEWRRCLRVLTAVEIRRFDLLKRIRKA